MKNAAFDHCAFTPVSVPIPTSIRSDHMRGKNRGRNDYNFIHFQKQLKASSPFHPAHFTAMVTNLIKTQVSTPQRSIQTTCAAWNF